MGAFSCNFISYTLARSVSVEVLLPGPAFAESNPSHHPEHPYPVLILIPDDEMAASTVLRMTSLERYAESHRLAVAVVSPENTAMQAASVRIPFGNMTLYGTPDKRDVRRIDYPEFLLGELPEFLGGTFPISLAPSDMYLAGIGTGGSSALLLGLSGKRRFGALCAIDPVYAPDSAWAKALRACADKKSASAVTIFSSGDVSALAQMLPSQTVSVVPQDRAGSRWARIDHALCALISQLPRADFYASLPPRKL